AFLDVPEHRFRRVETRFLMEKADRDTRRRERLSQKALVLAGHDPQQRALARAVQSEHADLGAKIKRQPDILENSRIGRMHLPETLHGVDELGHKRLQTSEFRTQN